MSYFIPEDVGTTARAKLSKTKVLKLWEKHKGICVTCGRAIDGSRDKWFAEHVISLVMGGPDDESNLGPAHWTCKAAKDADDLRMAAKAKRGKCARLGIKDPNRKRMPGGRDSRIKIKMDGTVIDRRTGELLRGRS